MKLFSKYLKQKIYCIIYLIIFCTIFAAAFCLYHLPIKAVAYPAILSLLIGIFFIIADFRKAYRKHACLLEIQKLTSNMMNYFPADDSIEGEDYQKIIRLIKSEQAQLETDMNLRYSDMIDYYTVWAHQIKTPIASMKLTLQGEDSDLTRRLSGDLFRIEQYVEMVLAFLRLDSTSGDYLIKEYNLDGIIKQSIRKFAGEFIVKKIHLEYSPVSRRIVTDEKWFAFVLEQIISNALKYTRKGSIKIYLNNENLCIEDTGIGIAPEDLPRIFEKGYTGYNGRSDKSASGLGLYLCRRICTKLGHTIKASSVLNNGTTIYISLSQRKTEAE